MARHVVTQLLLKVALALALIGGFGLLIKKEVNGITSFGNEGSGHEVSSPNNTKFLSPAEEEWEQQQSRDRQIRKGLIVVAGLLLMGMIIYHPRKTT